MRFQRVCAMVVLAAGVWSCAGSRAVAQQKIPEVHANALNGEVVNLPEALKGKVGVLVVGFSQSSREQVTPWGQRLAAEFRDSPTVLYYEMPVLASVPRLLRGWVLKKIADAVPERARSRFVPILDHEPAWKTAVGFTQSNDAYVVVVDGTGAVRGRLEGGASDANYAAVQRMVATAQ